VTVRYMVWWNVSQLSKSYADRALFDDVSLQVNRGDLIRFQKRIRVRPYYRQSEMFSSRLIVRAVALTIVVAAVNQYQ
jgi:hypothetical protein